MMNFIMEQNQTVRLPCNPLSKCVVIYEFSTRDRTDRKPINLSEDNFKITKPANPFK